MTIEKKLLGTSPSGGATDVADVFSTDLYTGAGGTQTITNGIDLSGEGGLVWVKHRTASNAHMLVDTERGVKRSISSNTTTAQTPANANNVDAFYSTGFQVGPDGSTNQPNGKFVSWTFRKKKKFFDIVTWTGNDTAGRTIPHNLGSVPAMMLVKMTNGTYSWNVYHSGIGATKFLELDTNNGGQTSSAVWNNTAPTDSVFTVGQEYGVNQGSKTYVAYLFADNSSEGADDQMIKCGSFTSSSANQAINLGWEPQFVLIKSSSNAMSWYIFDTMRGIVTSGNDSILAPNDALAEETASQYIDVTPTGFISHFNALAGSRDYIFMALRAEMMVEPEAATDVFAIDTGSASSTIPTFDAPFAVDFAIKTSPTQASNRGAGARIIQGRAAQTNDADAEVNDVNFKFDSMAGFGTNFGTAFIGYMWKRAKGYMDVVAFNGGGAGATVPHSLGVKPELFVYKRRNAGSEWMTYVSSVGATKAMFLDKEDVPESAVQWFNNTEPTNTVFTTGSKGFSGSTFIAYLFATIAGISKCGSYTGNGSYQTISCGFSAGSRFVLIKRTDAVGDWYVWDSVRGISAGNDPHLSLNTTAAQVNDDSIDPANAGFIVNQVSATNINVSSGTYIFYAIA